MTKPSPRSLRLHAALAFRMMILSAATAAAALSAQAQSRIIGLPGYDTWTKATEASKAYVSGAVSPYWAPDSSSFTYAFQGAEWRYDVKRRAATRIGETEPPKDAAPAAAGAQASLAPVFARGRGAEANKLSPDGKMRALTHDLNVYIAPVAPNAQETQITTDGDMNTRIRNGVGSYVYLEEFDVAQPVYWSPDSSKLAWMRYDESGVEDYFLQVSQMGMFSQVHTQAYPHPGRPNPVADLMVRDIATGKTIRMDVRDGHPFSDDVIGHYVWDAQWTKDGRELLVRRADRNQKVYDLAACSVETGACRTVVRETRPQSWAQGQDPFFLADGNRFVWVSERSDFANLYLYDLSGREIAQLTRHPFDVEKIVAVDEARGEVWYLAHSGDSHMKQQLHRVKLDGANDVRLTDPSLHHSVKVSPDRRYFTDVVQTHDRAPVTRLADRDGKIISVIAESDVAALKQLGAPPSELFTFTSADGVSNLDGIIHFPVGFDPSHRYPVVQYVYGGPSTNAASEVFAPPNELAQYGFIVVQLDARSAAGKGRKALDTIYQKLGVAEIDDFASGLKEVAKRPYVDGSRIGVYGTSYGGFVSAMLILRYPDLIRAAVANSPVTDFRLYDSAYTERYLGQPAESKDAYDATSAIALAPNLKGDLLIYYGTADDNVHPKNALQFIAALQKANKSFDVQVGPDKGHTSVDKTRMAEFFIDKLVLAPAPG